jgi:hypothetical protein
MRKIEFLALSCLALLIIIYPIFFRVNFSQFNFQVANVLNLSPFAIMLYLPLLQALFLFFIFRKSNAFRMLIPVVYIFCLVTLMQVSQLPTIGYVDFYSHMGMANNIFAHHSVDTVPDPYARFWPGNFLFFGTITQVLDLNPLMIPYIIESITNILFFFLLYVLGQKLLSHKNAYLLPLTYIILFTGYILNASDLTHQFSFVIASTGIFFLLRSERATTNLNTKAIVVCGVIGLALVISHPINAICYLFSFFSLIIFDFWQNRKNKVHIRPNGLYLAIFLSLFFSIWIVWHSGWLFSQGIEYAIQTLTLGRPTDFMYSTIAYVKSPLSIILEWYKNIMYGVALLLAGIAVLFLRKCSIMVKKLIFVSLSMAVAGALFYFLPGQMSTRPLYFGFFAVAGIAVIAISELSFLGKLKKVWPILLLILVLPNFLAAHNAYNFAFQYVNSWQDSTYSFAGNFSFPSETIGTEYVQVLGYYAQPNQIIPNPFELLSSYDTPQKWDQRLLGHPYLYDGNLVIRDEKQDAAFWKFADKLNALDEHLLTTNRVFDTFHSQIYSTNSSLAR